MMSVPPPRPPTTLLQQDPFLQLDLLHLIAFHSKVDHYWLSQFLRSNRLLRQAYYAVSSSYQLMKESELAASTQLNMISFRQSIHPETSITNLDNRSQFVTDLALGLEYVHTIFLPDGPFSRVRIAFDRWLREARRSMLTVCPASPQSVPSSDMQLKLIRSALSVSDGLPSQWRTQLLQLTTQVSHHTVALQRCCSMAKQAGFNLVDSSLGLGEATCLGQAVHCSLQLLNVVTLELENMVSVESLIKTQVRRLLISCPDALGSRHTIVSTENRLPTRSVTWQETGL